MRPNHPKHSPSTYARVWRESLSLSLTPSLLSLEGGREGEKKRAREGLLVLSPPSLPVPPQERRERESGRRSE
jgi:hypothetical protein